MALNEEKILSAKFVFISYSHLDKAVVWEDVQKLMAKGVRIWYDINMREGEKWTDIANQVLHHKNCAGVIFYNTSNSFKSRAVQIEQETTRRLGLKYWAVHIGGRSTVSIAFDTLKDIEQRYGATDSKFTEYMAHIMPEQQKMFPDESLYFSRNSSDEVVQAIYDKVAVPYRLVDNEDNFLADCEKNNLVGASNNAIVLGRYISEEYFGTEQAQSEEDCRFGVADDLIQFEGRRYATKELYWKLLYVEDGRAVLLCDRILSKASFVEGERFLREKFCMLAFSQLDKERFGEIKARFLTNEDVNKSTDKDALELNEKTMLKHWWINEQGLCREWKQTYSGSIHHKNGFLRLVKKGIRPVIEISASELR